MSYLTYIEHADLQVADDDIQGWTTCKCYFGLHPSAAHVCSLFMYNHVTHALWGAMSQADVDVLIAINNLFKHITARVLTYDTGDLDSIPVWDMFLSSALVKDRYDLGQAST
jgi:hypothetical protein